MKRVLICLAVCSLAAALVIREKRAVNTEEEEELLRPTTAGQKETELRICSPRTQCKWILTGDGASDVTVDNAYCVCSADEECTWTHYDTAIASHVYYCRKPQKQNDERSTSENI